MVKEYSKDIMDKAVALIIDEGYTVLSAAIAVGMPASTLSSELRARHIAVKSDEQYRVAKVTSMLFRLFDDFIHVPATTEQRQLVADAEDYIYARDRYTFAKANNEPDIDCQKYLSNLTECTKKARITTLRDLWTWLCGHIAKNYAWDQAISRLNDAVYYYDANDVQLLDEEFYDHMSKKQKRWSKMSNQVLDPTSKEGQIVALYDETAVRSDGKVIHLWNQKEIAQKVMLSQPQVSVVIAKWRK